MHQDRMPDNTANETDDRVIEHNVTLIFGKHRGKTFQFASKDWLYCRWVCDQKDGSGQFNRFKQYIITNKKIISDANYERGKTETGPLSKRVRSWDLETMRDKGVIISPLSLNNIFTGSTKRPRKAICDMQACGVVPEWNDTLIGTQKQEIKVLAALSSRFMSYVFRRMLHEFRVEPFTEPLIADRAMLVLARNYMAYMLAKEIANPRGDPDGRVDILELEDLLQRRRGLKDDNDLPESFIECFSRMGMCSKALLRMKDRHEQSIPMQSLDETVTGTTETTPRRIYNRFLMSESDLSKSLVTYRNVENKNWDDPDVIRACWVLARADGAFEYDRISNAEIPVALLKTNELLIYKHAIRATKYNFSLHLIPRGELVYGPCVGFGGSGCLMDIDYCTSDTVYAIRSSLFVNSAFDITYMQCYAGLARHHRKNITRACVLYLQHGSKYEVDMADHDHSKLLEFLNSTKNHIQNSCDVGMCETGPVSKYATKPEKHDV